MGSAEAAELTKLAETTYRDVNIALANEFARFADRTSIDIGRVIDAANSQPFSHIHRPGIAVGGHCIPVYPRFYLLGDPQARLPLVSREVNDSMPGYAVDLLAAELAGGLVDARVLILGVTYRGDVKETAFSGAFATRRELERRSARPLASDPLYDDAVRVVADTRRCSTSWLQRKLGLGYNRAARIVEMMERRGLVGPSNGAKDREVLVDAL